MFGYRMGFSGMADLMALFSIRTAAAILDNGDNVPPILMSEGDGGTKLLCDPIVLHALKNL